MFADNIKISTFVGRTFLSLGPCEPLNLKKFNGHSWKRWLNFGTWIKLSHLKHHCLTLGLVAILVFKLSVLIYKFVKGWKDNCTKLNFISEIKSSSSTLATYAFTGNGRKRKALAAIPNQWLLSRRTRRGQGIYFK